MPRVLDPARGLWCVLPECAMVTFKSLPVCRPRRDTFLYTSHYMCAYVAVLATYLETVLSIHTT